MRWLPETQKDQRRVQRHVDIRFVLSKPFDSIRSRLRQVKIAHFVVVGVAGARRNGSN